MKNHNINTSFVSPGFQTFGIYVITFLTWMLPWHSLIDEFVHPAVEEGLGLRVGRGESLF